MACPNCGKEMEPGWVYSREVPFWSPKPNKAFKIPDRESVVLSSVADYPVGYICKDCRKVILEY